MKLKSHYILLLALVSAQAGASTETDYKITRHVIDGVAVVSGEICEYNLETKDESCKLDFQTEDDPILQLDKIVSEGWKIREKQAPLKQKQLEYDGKIGLLELKAQVPFAGLTSKEKRTLRAFKEERLTFINRIEAYEVKIRQLTELEGFTKESNEINRENSKYFDENAYEYTRDFLLR